eukprot:TRINITY_DN1670_c1_g1_i1.p1 TRINITY_DN1670_c1_g1~~TRINITY_DN1670_c1_g1_i1.p1  ORF type:complete len:743 (-),score=213.23 TRINITY_DN1670_c1_g1_i1:54-2009(-)
MELEGIEGKVMGIEMTEWHYMIITKETLYGFCILNNKKTFKKIFPEKIQPLIGIIKDETFKNIYLFSEKFIYDLVGNEEERDIWQLFLQKKDFLNSLKFSKSPSSRDIVQSALADHLYSSGKIIESAYEYAKSSKSFEQVTLLFMNGEEKALKVYLIKKLEFLTNSTEKKSTQLSILAHWIIEIELNDIDSFEAQQKKNEKTSSEKNLLLFFSKYKSLLDYRTSKDLLLKHGHAHLLFEYNKIIGDWNSAIMYLLHKHDYVSIIELLLQKITVDVELYYQLSVPLLSHLPRLTVMLWMKTALKLDCRRLLPALTMYEPYTMNEEKDNVHWGIHYLMHVVSVNKNEDETVHNCLISLLCKLEDEKPLIHFLKSETQIFYDLQYALNLTLSSNKKHSASIIYTKMSLFEEAIDISLQVNYEIAVQYAKIVDDTDEKLKKIWLSIGKYVIEKEGNIQAAMKVISEGPYLKVEDLIPFFPDTTLINSFKEEINDQSRTYDHNIQEHKSEMEMIENNTNILRIELKSLRDTPLSLEINSKCFSCRLLINPSQPYYYFSCGHITHQDCLIKDVSERYEVDKKKEIFQLKKDIQYFKEKGVVEGRNAKGVIFKADVLKDKLDSIIASECFYCGSHIVETIDMDFYGEEEEVQKFSYDI